MGIPKEKIDSLFKKFGENVNPGIQRTNLRTGLGLFICKHIVELHGGKMWLDQDWGPKGTRFCFTISNSEKHTDKNIGHKK